MGRILLTMIVIFVLPIILYGSTALGLTAGDEAPQFINVTDLEGHLIAQDKYKDRPLFLSFWTSWCPQCKKNFSLIDELYTKYNPQGLQFLAVNAGYGDSLKRARAIQKKYEPKFPMAYAHESKMSKDFGVRGVPMFFLLDTEHTVVSVEYEITDQMIEAIIELLK